MVSKSIENPLKIDLWALLGTPLEPLGAHALQKARFWRPLGGSWGPTWLQLGGPKAPKSLPKPEKTDD